MHCPTLCELPPPPLRIIGWPWIETSPMLARTMPDGSPWPRISIVTPSNNKASSSRKLFALFYCKAIPTWNTSLAATAQMMLWRSSKSPNLVWYSERTDEKTLDINHHPIL
jgi:hypothetical protein